MKRRDRSLVEALRQATITAVLCVVMFLLGFYGVLYLGRWFM